MLRYTAYFSSSNKILHATMHLYETAIIVLIRIQTTFYITELVKTQTAKKTESEERPSSRIFFLAANCTTDPHDDTAASLTRATPASRAVASFFPMLRRSPYTTMSCRIYTPVRLSRHMSKQLVRRCSASAEIERRARIVATGIRRPIVFFSSSFVCSMKWCVYVLRGPRGFFLGDRKWMTRAAIADGLGRRRCFLFVFGRRRGSIRLGAD